MSTLNVSVEDYVMWAEIDRPEVNNAINFALMDELAEAVDRIEKDESVRVFVLSGAGDRAFASGGDLKEFHTIRSEEEARVMSRKMLSILKKVTELPCITIACLNGDAYGGGIEIALAFDIRLAAAHSRIGFTQGRFYLPPGWGGLTRLVRIVGPATALLWLSSHRLIDAPTALQHRLVEEVVPSDRISVHTRKLAGEIAAKTDRRMIQAYKNGLRKSSRHDMDESIEEELNEFVRFWADDEHFRRVDQFIASRRDNK
jgi:enoyl-CoA hydratase